MKVVASTGRSQTAPAMIHRHPSEISSVESPELSSPASSITKWSSLQGIIE
jgi:hypothetical protein